MNQQNNIVSVKLPSGFVFQFEKPTLLGMLSTGIVPESIANEAIESWLDDGIGFPASDSNYLDTSKKKQDETLRAQAIQRKIIELSISPKLVNGVADKTRGEISLSALPIADVKAIHEWFLTGGYDCAELRLWAKNHEMVLAVALNADKMHTAASLMLGVDNKIIAYEIDKICTHRLLIWEAAKNRDQAKLDWYVQVMAQLGKELEFNEVEPRAPKKLPPIVDLPMGGKGRIYPDGSIEV